MVLGSLGKITNIFFLFSWISIYAEKITGVTNVSSLIEKEDACFHEVYPSSNFECGQYPLAKDFYPEYNTNPLTMYDGGVHFNPSGILQIPNGKVTSDEGIVISFQNKLLDHSVEFFFAGGRAKFQASNHLILKKQLGIPKKYYETVAVLACRNYTCYYGWLFNLLPSYHLLTQSNLHYDHLYLPPLNYRFQKESLELLGVPYKEHALNAHKNTYIEAQTLLVPTKSENKKQYPSWQINFLRESFLPYTQPTGKKNRIYIPRKSRVLKNEKELLAHLEPLGFKKVYLEDLSFLEQVQLFSEAEYVIGVHGAGFSNIVFCPKDVVIIEIFNQGWLSPTYWGVSQHLKQTHHCVLSDMSKLSSSEKRLFQSYVSVHKVIDLLSLT